MAWDDFVSDAHSTPATERIAMILHIFSIMLSIQNTLYITKIRKKGSNCVLGKTTFPKFIWLQSDFSFHHFERDTVS